MNAPLYTTEILRLAASIPQPCSLERIDGAAEERSPTCGSRIRTEVQLDGSGRVRFLSQQVHACAFGQASAALLAANARGRSREDIAAALLELSAWLGGEGDVPALVPGATALEPARSRRSRHGAILLPFRALVAAIQGAAK